MNPFLAGNFLGIPPQIMLAFQCCSRVSVNSPKGEAAIGLLMTAFIGCSRKLQVLYGPAPTPSIAPRPG